MKKLLSNTKNLILALSVKQFVTLCFLLALVICSSLLATWQIKWLNQASQTKLLSAQREMALETAKFIESNVQIIESVLDTPEQFPEVVLSTAKVQISHVQHQLYLESQNLNIQKWEAILSQLPLAKNDDFRASEDVLERNLPANIFFKLDSQKNESVTTAIHNATLYEIDLLALSQLFLASLESDTYQYQLTLDGKILAGSTSNSQINEADLIIPISFYLKDSKRARTISRFNSDKSQSVRINFYWIYESILRQFSNVKKDNLLFNERKNHYTIEVFNIDESLLNSIRNQKIILMFFSIAIVILLTATAFFLVFGIHRSQTQRRLEQEFIATVSHELRTPLTVIQSAADNLNEGFVSKPEAIARYGSEIKKQSQRLNRMIESTLMYSGMPNQSKAKQDEVETYEFLNEIISPLTQLANNHDIELSPQFNGLPVKFITDVNALRMIIENLIMNSIIHGQAKHEASKINLLLNVNNNHLVIQINDNGSGIAKREQKRIFKAFVRGKVSEQNQHPGSGLGLNLIKRMVNILNGKLELQSPYLNEQSQKQSGAQFIIELPITTLNNETSA